MIEVELLPTIEIESKTRQKLKVQIFLVCLLVPLALVGWSYFRLVKASTLGLIIGLAIGGVKSIGEEITVGFLG